MWTNTRWELELFQEASQDRWRSTNSRVTYLVFIRHGRLWNCPTTPHAFLSLQAGPHIQVLPLFLMQLHATCHQRPSPNSCVHCQAFLGAAISGACLNKQCTSNVQCTMFNGKKIVLLFLTLILAKAILFLCTSVFSFQEGAHLNWWNLNLSLLCLEICPDMSTNLWWNLF